MKPTMAYSVSEDVNIQLQQVKHTVTRTVLNVSVRSVMKVYTLYFTGTDKNTAVQQEGHRHNDRHIMPVVYRNSIHVIC